MMLFNSRKACILWASLCLLSGCAKQAYIAKPIDPHAYIEKTQHHAINSDAFQQYLIKQGYPANSLPFQAWGLEELTLSALFHHADLNVSKAKLALAEANIATAGLQTGLGVNGTIARSNRANGDISPWSYGLQVDIPIVTTQKRQIRIEEAQYLAEAARMDVAETAWRLRQKLNVDLLDYYENAQQISQLQTEFGLYSQLTTLYSKRLALGLAASTELAQYTLQQQKSLAALQQARTQTQVILQTLATDAGLPIAQLQSIPIKPLALAPVLAQQESALLTQLNSLQTDALLNRIDIRRGLARYGAAESKIKLEVAKQTPDITLSPGYLFEFGDNIWSLGFTSLLNLIQPQPTLIKEAERLRAIEGAQFESLQANIIGQLALTLAQHQAAKNKLALATQAWSAQMQYQQKLEKQFKLGLIDKVALTQSQLNVGLSVQQLKTAQFALLRAQAEVENMRQQPLTAQQTLQNATALSTD